MRTIVLALLLLSACVTRVVEKPVEKPTPTVSEPLNHAADVVALVKPLVAQGLVCKPWTGAGTAFPGVDAFLCEAPTALVWCGAPVDGPPKCIEAIDWTPPRQPAPSVAPPSGDATAKETAKPKASPPPPKK